MRNLTDAQMEELSDERPRAFSYEQEAQIARQEKLCRDAGCDDDGHKCFDTEETPMLDEMARKINADPYFGNAPNNQ